MDPEVNRQSSKFLAMFESTVRRNFCVTLIDRSSSLRTDAFVGPFEVMGMYMRILTTISWSTFGFKILSFSVQLHGGKWISQQHHRVPLKMVSASCTVRWRLVAKVRATPAHTVFCVRALLKFLEKTQSSAISCEEREWENFAICQCGITVSCNRTKVSIR